MQTETTGAASPGTPSTETVSAERAAADRGDVSAFLQASRDRRTGKPAANVERPKADGQQTRGSDTNADATGRPVVAGREGTPAKGPTDRDREADERLTTRIRDAVDTATADSRRQIRELEERLAATTRATSTTDTRGTGAATTGESPRKALTSADIKRYQAMPDAPKLDDKDTAGNFLYETAQEHSVALADFIGEARATERADAQRTTGDRVARVRKEAERVTTFAGRIEAFKQAHADRLVDNGKGQKIALPLAPAIGGLYGFAKLAEINAQRQQSGQPPIAATIDHAIAEEIYDSDLPGDVLLFLSDHPEELAALRQCQTPAQLTRVFGRLEQKALGGSTTTASAAGKAPGAGASDTDTTAEARRKAADAVDRSVSSAKPLQGNLGRAGNASTDPEESAVKAQDFGAFQQVQRARRVEKFNGARR